MVFCLCLLTLQIFPWWAEWCWLPGRKGSWVTCHSFLSRHKLPTKVPLAVHWLWGNNSVGWDRRSQQRACLESSTSLDARQLCHYSGSPCSDPLVPSPSNSILRVLSKRTEFLLFPLSHSTSELFHSTFKPIILSLHPLSSLLIE